MHVLQETLYEAEQTLKRQFDEMADSNRKWEERVDGRSQHIESILYSLIGNNTHGSTAVLRENLNILNTGVINPGASQCTDMDVEGASTL